VSITQTMLLGAIAGFTIYLGLPLGRVRVASLRIKAFLNAASAGILVFLLFEILAHATEPVEHTLEEATQGEAAWGQFAALGLVYAIGFGAGLLSLLYLPRMWKRPSPPERSSIGPGAMSVAEAELSQPAAQQAVLRTGMGIAAGIGLHNFSEGLAIGQAAQAEEMTLAALLIIGLAPQHDRGRRHRWPAGRRRRARLLGLARPGGADRRGTDLPRHHRRHLVRLRLPVRRLPSAGRGCAAVRHRRDPARRPPSLLGGHALGLMAGFILALATELVLEVAGGRPQDPRPADTTQRPNRIARPAAQEHPFGGAAPGPPSKRAFHHDS
jgi:hypothetical protein